MAFSNLSSVLKELEDKEASMSEDFAKIKRELNSDTINPDIYLKLNRTLTDAKQKIEEIGKQEELKKKLRGNLEIALDALNEAWRQEFLALEKEVAKINEANSNLTIYERFKGFGAYRVRRRR